MPLFSNKLSPERTCEDVLKVLFFSCLFFCSVQPFRGRCDVKKHGQLLDGAAEIFKRYSSPSAMVGVPS